MRLFIFSILTLVSSWSYAQGQAFTLPLMNGAESPMTYSSADHPNGIFIVEAYFQRCGDCNANAANVNSLATEYAAHPRVQVLDVSRDCRDSDYTAWINRHHPNHPVLNDCAGALRNQLGGVSFYPTTFVLDCHLNVLFRSEDAWSAHEFAQIRQAINRQLMSDCQ